MEAKIMTRTSGKERVGQFFGEQPEQSDRRNTLLVFSEVMILRTNFRGPNISIKGSFHCIMKPTCSSAIIPSG